MWGADTETLELQLIRAGDTEALQAYGKETNASTETGGDTEEGQIEARLGAPT